MLEHPNSLLIDFNSPCGDYRLTFEDDGKVAYAYLKRGNEAVGDVWLYNRCPAPEKAEWADRRNIPFANAQDYMTENGRVEAAVGLDDVKVDWEYEEASPVAYVYLFDDLCGVVGVNDMPGYARFAAKNGPIARVMVIGS
jgi:hypothetical protein